MKLTSDSNLSDVRLQFEPPFIALVEGKCIKDLSWITKYIKHILEEFAVSNGFG